MAKNARKNTQEGGTQGVMGALAGYACLAEQTRGRLHAEEESATRSVYQRDRDRIIHSAAFRRLEYKTQVFVNHEGDHFRTRLTHSLEVAQLARSIARELALDEDLSEALALAHDLGHPPFGHAGEAGLQGVMVDFGGFDHNAQSLRVLTKLEQIYAEFDGLNLTWETLEGVAKHNGPRVEKADEAPAARALAEYTAQHDLELHSYASLEAQITALCDDIAYNNHDIEDGLRAGLFAREDVMAVPLVGEVFAEVRQHYPELDDARLIHETKRRLINRMCSDLVEETRHNIENANVQTVADVRGLSYATAAFSETMTEQMQAVKAFLNERMYRHYKVNRMTSKATRILHELFTFFLERPDTLPPEWYARTDGPGSQTTAVAAADYIAGMTDRYAVQEHKRVFDVTYKIIGG